MTREEAILEVRQAIRNAPVHIKPEDLAQWAVVIVNTLSALGFGFPSPRSAADRLHDELAHTLVEFLTVWDAIDRAGLKLVDK